MSEIQSVALQIALANGAFKKTNDDDKNEAILNAYEDAKLFLFLTGKDVQDND